MYWTRSKGTGGSIKDFIVEEIPSRKFFAKFTRTNSGIENIKGPYTLALLKKRGITTHDAIKFLSKKFGAEIGYAGLKDKHAVTSQYITVKGSIDDIKTDRMQLTKIGLTNKMMQIGDLEGNKFYITLRGCKIERIEKIIEEIKSRGLPNYFGPQRFGLEGNHKIGKLILQKKYGEALRIINKRSKRKYDSIKDVDKKALKFFIHAYQSFIFNSVLDKYIPGYPKPFFGNFPIVGYDTKLKNDFASKEIKKIIDKDMIKIGNFEIKGLNVKCIGSVRQYFIKIKKIDYQIKRKTVKLEFDLPKGSYATVLIKEIAKSPNIHKSF